MHGSKADLDKTVDVSELTVWEAEWGGIRVSFVTCHQELDISPVLKGLPDDLCQCPHWGMILKGRKLVKYRDREETLSAGEAYYMEPGHTTVTAAGTEWLEFSPSGEMEKTDEVVKRNLAKMNRA